MSSIHSGGPSPEPVSGNIGVDKYNQPKLTLKVPEKFNSAKKVFVEISKPGFLDRVKSFFSSSPTHIDVLVKNEANNEEVKVAIKVKDLVKLFGPFSLKEKEILSASKQVGGVERLINLYVDIAHQQAGIPNPSIEATRNDTPTELPPERNSLSDKEDEPKKWERL